MVSFLFVLLLCAAGYICNAQATVNYWDYKFAVQLTVQYTISSNVSHNESLQSDDVEDDVLLIIGNDSVIDGVQHKVYVNVHFLVSESDAGDDAHLISGEMIINITIWSDDEEFFTEMQSFLVSDAFQDTLQLDLESNYDSLVIADIDHSIIDVHHGHDASIWQQWTDFKNYTNFQWIVVSVVLFVLVLVCCCLTYCCCCRASKRPVRYDQVELHAQMPPIQTYGYDYDYDARNGYYQGGTPLVPNHTNQEDERVHWVEI